MPRDSRPFISERSPTYRRAQSLDWSDPRLGADAQTTGTFIRLVELERDMIAALLAVRNRLGQATDRSQIDELLADHADRLPVLEQRIRELGGVPPDPGERPGDLPRDASDIAYLESERECLRALADDHERLAEQYRDALAFPHHDEESRRILELYANEMEHHEAHLAALVDV
ncbi:MAG TPA: ferritin-like domain-containing protein [Kofleriaceae bacterium]|nr:ferritin-like domain-containing protein [Kofleriaceae bacterium]